MIEVVEKQGRDYFLRLFNGMADAVFIAECCSDGSPGKYVEVNDVACEMLQLSRGQILQLSPYQINRMALEDQDTYATIIDNIKTTGKALFKTELLCHDEHWVPVEIGSQLFELDGQAVFFSVVRDITLREKYEASIQTLVRSTVGLTGQACLEEIIRNLCDWLDVDGACIGVVHGDIIEIRANFLDGHYQAASRLPVHHSPFQQVLAGQFCLYPEEAEALLLPEHIPPLDKISSFIGSPMLGHDGKVMGCVCAYSRKPLQSVPHIQELLSVITSRAAAECERMHFFRELSRSEEKLRTVFNSTAEAIVGIDLRGNVVFCNPSTAKILGYSAEAEFIGQNFCQLVRPDTRKNPVLMNMECPFITAIASGARLSSEDEFFAHRDGHQIPVEYWGHPMKRDDKLVGGVVTFIDITRRKALEKQLFHSQRMEAIGTLTGGIAHDFNNILTVISGYVGLLQSQLADKPKLLSKIKKIGEAAERGSQLTHGLLAYSRKKSDPSTPVNLNRLVLNVQSIFGQIIGEQIELILTLAEQQLVVLAEPSQFEQVLVNLATNARDAMRDGGVLSIKTERIEIDQGFCQTHGYGRPGLYALISVADSGTGITKDIQQKIFDPFFTTKDTGKGTGLGLAMVWGIVKQHNGYILLDSAPGAGSCFKIYLPLTTQPLPLSVETINDQLPGGEETILLVEDDPLVRESTTAILTTVGYQVVSSDCAEAALKILDQEKYDLSLILSDVVMPGLKGTEFYQQIRKRTTIPVIFISGYTFDSLLEQGLVGEGVILLNKPIEPIILLTNIREILESN